jgi:hypothetical protein
MTRWWSAVAGRVVRRRVGGSTDDGSRRRVRALWLSDAVVVTDIEASGGSVGDR